MADKSHYSDADFAGKERFVQAALEQVRPARVLDVGCNTGHFSALAARAGASVVALDGDAAVAGRVWRRAEADGSTSSRWWSTSRGPAPPPAGATPSAPRFWRAPRATPTWC